jgi:hypothetical protein
MDIRHEGGQVQDLPLQSRRFARPPALRWMRIPRQVEESGLHRGLPNLFGYFQGRFKCAPVYFAASFRTVVELRIVAGMPIAFSSSAPENAESLFLVRHCQ